MTYLVPTRNAHYWYITLINSTQPSRTLFMLLSITATITGRENIRHYCCHWMNEEWMKDHYQRSLLSFAASCYRVTTRYTWQNHYRYHGLIWTTVLPPPVRLTFTIILTLTLENRNTAITVLLTFLLQNRIRFPRPLHTTNIYRRKWGRKVCKREEVYMREWRGNKPLKFMS